MAAAKDACRDSAEDNGKLVAMGGTLELIGFTTCRCCSSFFVLFHQLSFNNNNNNNKPLGVYNSQQLTQ